jgi:hypothetical protein
MRVGRRDLAEPDADVEKLSLAARVVAGRLRDVPDGFRRRPEELHGRAGVDQPAAGPERLHGDVLIREPVADQPAG